MKKVAWAALPLALAGAFAVHHEVQASDHDDGDTDLKSRALNLTDHFAFKSPSSPDELGVITYLSPRSLPGHEYFLSTAARYEQHVNKVANKTDAPAVSAPDDYTFRYEADAPAADGTQNITVTVLKNGTVAGTTTGKSTSYANSKAGNLTINTGNVAGLDLKWFVGERADSFHFDVIRFFQVRAFLAQFFFGGAGGTPDPTHASLAPNCRGDVFLGSDAGTPDADHINLWNPPSCAPDFTHNYNVISIAMNSKIAQLGGTVFDTWSTISVSGE